MKVNDWVIYRGQSMDSASLYEGEKYQIQKLESSGRYANLVGITGTVVLTNLEPIKGERRDMSFLGNMNIGDNLYLLVPTKVKLEKVRFINCSETRFAVETMLDPEVKAEGVNHEASYYQVLMVSEGKVKVVQGMYLYEKQTDIIKSKILSYRKKISDFESKIVELEAQVEDEEQKAQESF